MAITKNKARILYVTLVILIFSKGILLAQKRHVVKSEEVLKSIIKNKPVSLQNVIVEGDLDFTKLPAYRESNIQHRVIVRSPLYFQNCTFKGKIKGYDEDHQRIVLSNFETNLSFYNCTFYGDIILRGAIIGTTLIMSESKLHGDIHLENALMGHDANFSSVIFGRKVFFQNAIFRKNAYFNKAIFNEAAQFQSCKWEGEAIFREVEFRENVDFSLQKTFSPMSFNYSHFQKTVFFEGSKFGDDVEVDHTSAERILLSGCQFWQKLNFEGLNVKEIHFTNAIFYTVFPNFLKILNPETILEQSGIRYLGKLK